jgi:hypothetical protein
MPSTLAHLSTLAAAALLLGAPAANAQLVNGGFDAPETQQTGDGYCYLGIGDYRECGSVPGWSGYFQVISAQSSAWQTPAANGGWSSSQGSRLAGLQNSSHMTQDVTLAAGSYTLSWLDSNRVWYAGNTYEVRLDGNLLGSFSTVPGAAWTAQSLQFSVGAGTHALSWTGLRTSGDGTSFIDSVTLAAQPVPEPQTAMLLAGGLAVVALWRRRARPA